MRPKAIVTPKIDCGMAMLAIGKVSVGSTND